MRFALGLAIPIAAALLQGTVAPFITIGGARPSLPLLVAAALVALAALTAGLLYLGILAATGQGAPSLPLAVGTAVAAALYTGLLAVAIYPIARLVRRVTEKQGALGVW